MSDFDWKAILANVAPVLGTTVGGPFGALAGKILGNVLLGKDNATDDEIKAAVTGATPEQLMALKVADLQFKKDMAQLNVDLEKIASEDRNSARRREVDAHDSWTPRLIGLVVVVAWGVIQYFLLTHVIDPSMREIIARLLGTLDAALMCILYYYFGSSSGSARKDNIAATRPDDSRK